MLQKDTLFSRPISELNDWQFDEKVAHVFSDMVERSIPGYATIIKMIGQFASRFVQDQTQIYDLGCSLGEASLSILRHLNHRSASILAIDNSAPMVERCKIRLAQYKHTLDYQVLCDDICQIPIQNASFVVLNFTLQFIPRAERLALIQKIYAGLKPNGVLILSEKYHFDDPVMNELLIDLHYDFKRANGYSELEISQKRTMLENVMLLDPIETHLERLRSVGFRSVSTWYQCLNFGSMIAIK